MILSDLFEEDCYLQDVALLDRLCAERLAAEAETVKAEGWKWVEIAADASHSTLQPYQRQRGKHQPTAKQAKLLDKLQAEFAELTQKDEYTDEESDRAYALEEELDDLKAACLAFSDRQKAQGGAIVALDGDGTLRIVRGLIAPADIKAAKRDAEDDTAATGDEVTDDTNTGLSAKLVADLTAHHAYALRAVLSDQPQTALVAVVHALALAVLYRETSTGAFVGTRDNVLDIRVVVPWLRAEGLEESRAEQRIAERHQAWMKELPEDPALLWDWLRQQELQRLLDLLGFCAAQTIKAEDSSAFDTLAGAVSLDMAQWWEPTAAGYLGRVSKPQILEAVTEGVSAAAADNIKNLKKAEMAAKAEELLKGKGWTPVPLR